MSFFRQKPKVVTKLQITTFLAFLLKLHDPSARRDASCSIEVESDDNEKKSNLQRSQRRYPSTSNRKASRAIDLIRFLLIQTMLVFFISTQAKRLDAAKAFVRRKGCETFTRQRTDEKSIEFFYQNGFESLQSSK